VKAPKRRQIRGVLVSLAEILNQSVQLRHQLDRILFRPLPGTEGEEIGASYRHRSRIGLDPQAKPAIGLHALVFGHGDVDKGGISDAETGIAFDGCLHVLAGESEEPAR
jgi:hypothetical protein